MKKEPKPDIAGMLLQVQQQITFLEKKIDALISQRQPEKNFNRPQQQFEAKKGNDYRERTLYKAVCADCRKECEVPFKPSGERPVYCKECFSKRKSATAGGGNFGGGSAFHARRENKPRETMIKDRPAAAPREPRSSEEYYKEKNRRFIEKKKGAVKKTKRARKK